MKTLEEINLQIHQVPAVCDSFCQTDQLQTPTSADVRPLPPPRRPFKVLSDEMKACPRLLAHLRRS